MYSVISILEDDDEPTRRVPWRVIGIILLIVFLAIYSSNVMRQAAAQFRVDRHANALALAGPIAEAVEAGFLPDSLADPAFTTEALAPLFAEERALAAVRIWNAKRQLIAEISRPRLAEARDGALPTLDIEAAMRPYASRVNSKSWTDPIAQLMLLQNDQAVLVERMEASLELPPAKELSQSLYVPQDTLLQLVETMESEHVLLYDTRRDMNKVLEALTLDDAEKALHLAIEAANSAQADLTLSLSGYRSSITSLPPLPKRLIQHAPPSANWMARLWRGVEGERVLVPLFIPSTNSQLLRHAGFAEVILYVRSADMLTGIGSRWIPVAVALALMCALALWPGRRKQQRLH